MINVDLRDFYFKNIQKTEYHYQFYNFIRDINKEYNIFIGEHEAENHEFDVYDVEEAISKFRELCQPDANVSNNENKCWFYLVTYYLDKSGYEIKEFPRVLARPPKEPYDFTYKSIRNKIFELGDDDNGKVPYAKHRAFIARMTFERKPYSVDVDDWINQKFIEISNRQAPFNDMSINEKLAEIDNLLEHMLKKNGKFITPEYSAICFEYITDANVKSYRKKMQCFRHATAEAIAERNSYTQDQKEFFIDYGITILNVVHSLVKT